MDRRSFLTNAGAAGAALAVPTLLTSRKARAFPVGCLGGQPCAFYTPAASSAGAMHAVATANLLKGTAAAADYTNVSSALSTLASAWAGANIDAALKPGYATVTAAMLADGTNYPAAQIAANIAPYYSISASQVQTAFGNFIRYIDFYEKGYVQQILSDVQDNGLLKYINSAQTFATSLAGIFKTYDPVLKGTGYVAEQVGGAAPPIPRTFPANTIPSAFWLSAPRLAF